MLLQKVAVLLSGGGISRDRAAEFKRLILGKVQSRELSAGWRRVARAPLASVRWALHATKPLCCRCSFVVAVVVDDICEGRYGAALRHHVLVNDESLRAPRDVAVNL